MIKNQFYYTFKNQKNEDATGSFNVNMVIRTLPMEGGGSVVFLNDFHEMLQPTEVPSPNGKRVEIQMRKNDVCSQIELNKEDTIRLKEKIEI